MRTVKRVRGGWGYQRVNLNLNRKCDYRHEHITYCIAASGISAVGLSKNVKETTRLMFLSHSSGEVSGQGPVEDLVDHWTGPVYFPLQRRCLAYRRQFSLGNTTSASNQRKIADAMSALPPSPDI